MAGHYIKALRLEHKYNIACFKDCEHLPKRLVNVVLVFFKLWFHMSKICPRQLVRTVVVNEGQTSSCAQNG